MTAPAAGSVMHAWRKHRGSSVPMYDEIPVPATPPTGYLVKVLAAGVCHSDYAILHTENISTYEEKFTLGHEGCGVIVDIGHEVKNTKLKKGDTVATFMVPGCGKQECPECSRDLSHLCMNAPRYGLGQSGMFAPYIAITERAAVPVPPGVTPAECAAATDAVVTAYHGLVKRAQLQPNEVIFLFGLGGLGWNALQIIRTIGARVIVSDTREAPLEAAARLGVPRKDIVPVGKSIPEFVIENGLDNKIDIAADFVGIEQTMSDAQTIVRRGGRILCVGLMAPETRNITRLCIMKRLTLLFTFGGQQQDVVEVLDMIAKKQIVPAVETGPLENFAKVIEDLHRGKIKSRMALIPPEV